MWERRHLIGGLLAAVSFLPANVWAQGLIVPGAGARNRSMAGASTAAPLDAAGASYWNPAAIGGLAKDQFYFSAELVYCDTNTSSFVPAGAVIPPAASGGPFPPTDQGGTTFSDSGLAALPTIALIYHPENPRVTIGLGVFAAIGGTANFAGDPTNPVFTPHNPPPQFGGTGSPPYTFGFGPQYSSAAALQLAPIIAYRCTDRLTIGGGPTIDMMSLTFDPAFFAARNSNGTFPPATHGRPFWGGGFQAGVFYELNPCWNFGLSYKSEQWFETFHYNSADETGVALDIFLDYSLPSIVSFGVAYRGFRNTILAFDLRYLDYAAASTLGEPVSAGGTAWQSIFAAAFGMQYQFNDKLSFRMGLLVSENPIANTATLFNVELPTINQYQFSLGMTTRLGRKLSLDFAWVHGFENSIEGPIGQVPGTTVGIDQSLDSWIFGLGCDY